MRSNNEMPSNDTIDTLNRVLVSLTRSFPQYLRYARPFIPPGCQNGMDTILEIGAGPEKLAVRIAHSIFEWGGLPDAGKFPIEFTDTHDLAIDFLIQQAIECQKQDIAQLDQCVETLRMAPAAQSLAAEALGMAKGHLESLDELKGKAGHSTIVRDGAPAFANDPPISKEAAGTPHRQEERKLLAGDPNAPA